VPPGRVALRFLIALYNKETARPNLQFAAILASRLSTDLTVLYVEPGMKRSMIQEMNLARMKMDEWHMESAGYQILRDAREHLASMGLIKPSGRAGELRQLVSIAGEYFVQLPGTGEGIEKVTFRYREGDSIEEILAEMREHHHEVLVIGASKNPEFLTRLLKFSPSSILIVKNPQDIRYKILAATDGTPPAHRAELLAIKTASFLKMKLTFLTVARSGEERDFLEKHLKRMTGVCDMKKVEYEVIISEGDIVRNIADAAGDDHIIFLGRSRRKPLAKLFLGSKTIKVVEAANCPLLLVK
jgi:nucleotide-binding universal stress UspA family protein